MTKRDSLALSILVALPQSELFITPKDCPEIDSGASPGFFVLTLDFYLRDGIVSR
jgi:hypothetical protein